MTAARCRCHAKQPPAKSADPLAAGSLWAIQLPHEPACWTWRSSKRGDRGGSTPARAFPRPHRAHRRTDSPTKCESSTNGVPRLGCGKCSSLTHPGGQRGRPPPRRASRSLSGGAETRRPSAATDSGAAVAEAAPRVARLLRGDTDSAFDGRFCFDASGWSFASTCGGLWPIEPLSGSLPLVFVHRAVGLDENCLGCERFVRLDQTHADAR